MKNFKIYSLLIVLLFTIAACDDDENKGSSPDFNESIGAVTLIDIHPEKSFFDIYSDEFPSEVIEFEVNVDGFGITEVSSVDLILIFTEYEAINDPLRGGILDSVYAPIFLQNITQFPSTISYTVADMARELGKSPEDFKIGDTYRITFPIYTADGRKLSVALNSDLCQQPAQPSAGGCSVEWPVSCSSNVPEGTWVTNVKDYEIEIIAEGGGSYSIPNFNLDYDPDYPNFNTPIGGGFTEVCNTVNLGKVAEFDVKWTARGTYDSVAQTIFFPNIRDTQYGGGPWDNDGEGYLLTKK